MDEIYDKELLGTDFLTSRVRLLEISHYLERYLWPNYSETSSTKHIMSILVMVNEKFQEDVQVSPAYNGN